MAAPGKHSKWGSFLSQAVAGVESRLDNILADADDDQQQPRQATTVNAAPAASNKTAPQPSPQKKQQLAPLAKENTPRKPP